MPKSELERSCLWLTVVATVLVAATFLFGGRLGAWQWWAAVAVVLARSVWTARGRGRVIAPLGFLGFLAFLWLFSRFTFTLENFDLSRYHLPAIRLMIDGWNPVWQNTPEKIAAATGIATDQLHVWHVICMPRSFWYLCAAAYGFTHDAFNLMGAATLLLAVPLASAVWDALDGQGRICRTAAVAFVLFMLPLGNGGTDMAVAIGGIGLLAAMFDCLRTGRWDMTRIVCFAFWFASTKQLAAFHCALFFLAFLVFAEARSRRGTLVKVLRAGAVITPLYVLVSVSPLVTNAVEFGHPLYPQCTADAKRLPSHDLLWDFRAQNADAAAMGRLARFANGYVSSVAANAVCGWLTGRRDFAPSVAAWREDLPHTPTDAHFKVIFSLALVLLLAFGGRPERFAGALMLVGALGVPLVTIGYIRYVPWIPPAAVFALPMLFRIPVEDGVPWGGVVRAFHAAVAIVCAGLLAAIVWGLVRGRRTVDRILAEDPPRTLYAVGGSVAPNKVAYPDCGQVANLELLTREVPELAESKVVHSPAQVGRPFPTKGFSYEPSDGGVR